MIIYFSATGNSRHVANEIAKRTGDELMDIAKCCKDGIYDVDLKEGESLGVVVPTYFSLLPSVVDDYLAKLRIHSTQRDHYIFFVATCGSIIGETPFLANEHMKKKGFSFSAYYSVKMPDSWTPIFDLSDNEKIERKNKNADLEIYKISKMISEKKSGDFSHGKLPHFIIKPMRNIYNKARSTSHLKVSSSCIGCGLCERSCPESSIEIKDGKPFWIKDRCAMCLSCLHHCPEFAIQYGDKTKNHGQYVHP